MWQRVHDFEVKKYTDILELNFNSEKRLYPLRVITAAIAAKRLFLLKFSRNLVKDKIEQEQGNDPGHQLGTDVGRSCPFHAEQLIKYSQYTQPGQAFKQQPQVFVFIHSPFCIQICFKPRSHIHFLKNYRQLKHPG